MKITGASHKANVNGPTSVKLTAKLLSLKDKGADIVRAGSMMAIALTKNDKVQIEKGIDVNARLMTTDGTPVLKKSTDVFDLTLTLGKITHQGLKEKAVTDLAPGAEVELTDVYFSTSGMGIPWLTCSEFKVTKTMPVIDGARAATEAIRKSGDALVLSGALNTEIGTSRLPTLSWRIHFSFSVSRHFSFTQRADTLAKDSMCAPRAFLAFQRLA